jgi:uncharacterized protein
VKASSLPVAGGGSNYSGKALKLRFESIACGDFRFDIEECRTYHRAPMPDTLPDSLDPWRMVQGRRVFEGSLPLGQLQRLLGLLESAEGEAAYRIEFGIDDYDIGYVDITVDAGLPLVCQRTMSVYVQPVRIDQRLGLIRDESEEAALPEGYEPLLVSDGQVSLKDVIEDELILAVPLVALSPGAPLEKVPVTAGPDPDSGEPSNPFAALGQLKKSQH